jgi:uncharacterized protein (DUF1800 family)
MDPLPQYPSHARAPGRGPARALAVALLLVVSAATVASCSANHTRPPRAENTVDVQWLSRVAYSIDSETLARYRELGRAGYLDEQLKRDDLPLPAPIAAELATFEISHADITELLASAQAEHRRINALPDGPDRVAARRALNERGNQLANEAKRRDVLRALYSPAQLREQMVWFWLNHFSVFEHKGGIRWMIADYEEHAIRPHVFGHFSDLVLATLTHPAMLQYLDNAQNAVDHINENYARELMELHTLGVGSGYTQQDVQELARVLTGAGIDTNDHAPRLRREWVALYRRSGAFEFNPARHDFGPKVLLGRPIRSQGFAEIEEAVTRLTREPACATLISRELAVYFVSDDPPPALVARMAATFQRTDGDIGQVLRTLFAAPEFTASLGQKFRDPVHFVYGTLRVAYDGRPVVNTRPVVNWLNALGEPLYGHQTPDGYALTESAWASSGQMSRRFEIARAIGAGRAGLFEPEDGATRSGTAFPRLASRLYFEDLEPTLSTQTRAALDRATSQQEWNTLLLASPELNYR